EYGDYEPLAYPLNGRSAPVIGFSIARSRVIAWQMSGSGTVIANGAPCNSQPSSRNTFTASSRASGVSPVTVRYSFMVPGLSHKSTSTRAEYVFVFRRDEFGVEI